jgi:hypothetical protein
LNWSEILGIGVGISGSLGFYTIVVLMAITDHPPTDTQKEVLNPALTLALCELAIELGYQLGGGQ